MMDGYWHANRETMRVERMTRANDFNDMGRWKAFVTEHRKHLHLEDHNIFRNPRDAAISLAAYLVAKAKVRSTEMDMIMTAAEGLIKEHGIEEALYLAPIQVV